MNVLTELETKPEVDVPFPVEQQMRALLLDPVGKSLVRDIVKEALAWQGRPFLSISDFASVTGYSPDTVRDWIRGGSIPVVRVGRSVAIPVKQFLIWLEENTQYPDPPVIAGRNEPRYIPQPRRRAK